MLGKLREAARAATHQDPDATLVTLRSYMARARGQGNLGPQTHVAAGDSAMEIYEQAIVQARRYRAVRLQHLALATAAVAAHAVALCVLRSPTGGALAAELLKDLTAIYVAPKPKT